MDSQLTKPRKLTLKQETFCRLYATDAKFFGNATQAYIKAYAVNTDIPGAYTTARAAAHENLTKPHICERINQLLEDIGFTDTEVDKQLAFVIMQHGDLKAKMAGIKEYNQLKKRTSAGIVNNGIIAILGKYGLQDAGQAASTAPRLPEDTP